MVFIWPERSHVVLFEWGKMGRAAVSAGDGDWAGETGMTIRQRMTASLVRCAVFNVFMLTKL